MITGLGELLSLDLSSAKNSNSDVSARANFIFFCPSQG